MTSQFSPRVSQILAFSREEAVRLACNYVGPEHLLLGMMRIEGGVTPYIFNILHTDVAALKGAIEQKIVSTDVIQPINSQDIVLNSQANNVLRLAVLEARLQHIETVDEQHILLAILHDQTNTAARRVLEEYAVEYNTVKNILQPEDHRTKKEDNLFTSDDDDEDEPFFADDNDDSKSKKQQNSTTATADKKSKTPVIDNLGTDLTKAAAEGKLDPVVGRSKEIIRLAEILGRRKKNNPILIGEPGVGKSAIVEGLALQIVNHQTSPALFKKKVYTLDLTALVAGTKYRGQFEERIRALIKELEEHEDIIVFIDEIHTMIGAGSTPGSMDAANILKPALARGTIQCIGATTLDEYRNSIEKDGALERRFQKIIVEASTADETIQILQNIKERYEHHHHVTYSDDAITACVKLTERYITDRAFPDKAIDALDEVGSKIHLANIKIPTEITDMEKEIKLMIDKKKAAVNNQNFELAASYRDRQTQLEAELKEMNKRWANQDNTERPLITAEDVANVVSVMAGVPVQRIAQSEGIKIKGLANDLKSKVVAQDAAIDKMVKAIQRNRVGLKDPNHPIGVFMFLGPTGVGKTYLAKELAKYMFGSSDALIRIDMSEYSESFNVSRLVGAPPGYVGYEEGGQLTERVRRHPYSIVLLDEIEKAHGNVFNMLLQVLDEGRLTDGNGRLVDFRNTVIIMTSNAGTRQLKEFSRGVGFNASGLSADMTEHDKEYARSIIQKSLSKQFAPEFLNRLDDIITFDQLNLDAIKKIVDIELEQLFARIENIGYHATITDKAKEFVATKGYDIQFGARPLKRAIQTYIEDGLSDLIVNGDLKEGDTITIGKNPNKDELTFKPLQQEVVTA